jgi:hypothetical protein
LLVLFLELACNRRFAFSVVFLQFFINVILPACFLGMSCGCLAADEIVARGAKTILVVAYG